MIETSEEVDRQLVDIIVVQVEVFQSDDDSWKLSWLSDGKLLWFIVKFRSVCTDDDDDDDDDADDDDVRKSSDNEEIFLPVTISSCKIIMDHKDVQCLQWNWEKSKLKSF